MYASVRDAIALQGWPTIVEALEALSMDAVELEVDRDMKVRLVDGTNGSTHKTLDSKQAVLDYAEHLATNGVRASAFLLHNDFNRADVDAEINWVINVVNAASALAIPAIRIDAIMTGEQDLPLEKRVSHFADCMKKVLDSTHTHIVEMGIENHGFQGNDPEFLDKVLNAVGSDRLGLTLDTGNFYWRGHPLNKVYEIIKHFAPQTKHTHAKNIAYPAEIQQTERDMGYMYGEYVSPLPDGDIDHFQVVRILKHAGYKGDLCLEDESLGKFPKEKWQEVLLRDADHFRGALDAE